MDQNYKADMGDHFDENENIRQAAPLLQSIQNKS